jgi:outer membrane biosynthesis protein TonB
MADELSHARAQRPVALLQSPDRSPLVTYGVLGPTIVLPAGAEAWTGDRRRIALVHEMAHVRRHDSATLLAAELLRVVHWFNPLVWLACRRLRQESECACDDEVLSEGIEATDYATHLLEWARDAAGRQRAWASAPAIAHPSTLERRIAAMLSHQRNRGPLTRRARTAALLAAVAAGVSLAAAGVAPAPDQDLGVPARAGDVALTPATVTPEPVPAPAARQPAPVARTATAVAAQQAAAAIAGTMHDQTGGALPGVTLTLTDTASGARYAAVTAPEGRFAFRNLQPGQYELVASLAGFATVADAMTLLAGATVERPMILPLGTIVETLTVDCQVTPVAAAARPPSRRVTVDVAPLADRAVRSGNDPANTTTPGARHVLSDVASRGLVPVLSAQQLPDVMPVRVGGNIQAPTKLASASPPCPVAPLPAADTAVTLVGRIGADGAMHDVTPIAAERGAAPPRELTESARDAVRRWTFTPARLNGRPVDMNITVRVVYRRT